ncbi:TrmH family RNA methyltransferase [Pseudonocardia sp. HH130630-07]|uniref:TrmH family RNA methyltransferase n=1 Tax=Pseudonocardia sp. HH130630-07 TaxID=1690815 RepID=UPI000814F408|nr:TrmH family RNA methyltransferase [Pseudonocardia sp. HH130630-07]ANY07845.1 rRNA methyltransferase [Pseudonocardia sp. HH130630-07]
MPDLTSTANPRVKNLVRLRTRRHRDAAGVTLIEGRDELALALDAGVAPTEVYWAPDLVGDRDPAGLLDRMPGATRFSVSREVFARIAYRESPDGWLAVASAPGRPLEELELRPGPLVLVAEGIEKPGNVGAMLRTAEACGADAVVIATADRAGTDFANPNVVRASKGTVFAVPVASATTAQVRDWLRRRAIPAFVTTPAGRTELAAADLTGPAAIVVGTEATGVTDAWLDGGPGSGDRTVVIPMHGTVNSLNASIAAAVVLFEAVRQRAAAAATSQS